MRKKRNRGIIKVMKIINEHIQKQEFKNVYLLYGEEAYLKQQYSQKLVDALAGDDDMNRHVFSGKGIQSFEVADLGDTLPFFAPNRVIVVEESGWFKSGSEGFEERLKNFPDTTYIIFVESEVDKRSKLYKTVQALGYASEMNTPKGKELLTWITLQCKKEGKQIQQSAAEYLVERAGSNMNLLRMELEKVICYGIDSSVITLDMVQEMTSGQVDNEIFAMLDAIGNLNRDKALHYYHGLLELREPAMRILFLLTRQIHILLQVCEMVRLNMDNGSIASKASIPPFTVGKYRSQIGHFSYQQLLHMLDQCQDMDAGIKKGLYQDVIGVELLIIDFSTGNHKI